ncbi:MAG: hypothetical protein OXC26_06370 [Albidovulum sp.]|nr:hypothetical protein [Albidovulum sp.]
MLTVLYFTPSVKNAGGHRLLAFLPVGHPCGRTTGCRVTTRVVFVARFSDEQDRATMTAPGGDGQARTVADSARRVNDVSGAHDSTH